MSYTLRDGGEDPFAARLRLTRLVGDITEDPTALRQAYDLCGRRAEDAPILLDCLREQLTPTTPAPRRIALIELLCRLSRLPEYRPLIADSFAGLLEACNIRQGRDKEARSAAKALKNLLRAVGEEALKDYDELRAMLNGVLGMSEAEQRAQQQRQRVMEEIERDREGHRPLREASWSRPEGEAAEDEFRCTLKGFYALSSLDVQTSKHNSHAFCTINGIPLDSRAPADGNVLIVHLDETVLDHRWLCHSKDSSVRHAAEAFESLVRRLAKECFFYTDLREYDQPHVLYYEKDDDRRSLADHSFDRDPLAESQRRPAGNRDGVGSRRKFYQERAFRFRVASERYQGIAKGGPHLDRKQTRECQRLCQELDRALHGDLSDSLRALERLCRDAAAIFIVSDDHLSIVLARVVALDLASRIPPSNIYSTAKFDAEWTMREIRARTKDRPAYRVLGRSSHLEKATRRSFHDQHQGQFVRVRHLKDVRL